MRFRAVLATANPKDFPHRETWVACLWQGGSRVFFPFRENTHDVQQASQWLYAVPGYATFDPSPLGPAA